MDAPNIRITGVILAGGRARRMGGKDKGLLPFDRGETLAEHIASLLAPQVDSLVINANRNTEQYRRLGYPVVPDAVEGFQGPLAGMAGAMGVVKTPYMVTVPCDAPFLAPDLVERLVMALKDSGRGGNPAEISVAHDGRRLQPVFALLPVRLRESILGFLAAGGRKVGHWHGQRRMALADFSDRQGMFVNLNAPEDASRLGG
uniref:Molybdenum cofactor guanylyltransferase n=1 Tax=Candidatus Kentrum sp. DK TaxID=2126562 RepID=A0A450SX75_9GAMM|nr:MAG: molybdenum cofactor guanylyltransferase [Candidatus Kentron sp. DK]